MIKQIINFVKAWVRNDEAELNVEFEIKVTWVDLGITIGLVILGVILWK